MAAPLTTTSYAILGLLAIKPWTTYELAQQMDRVLNRFWPRTRSKLFEEPKKPAAQDTPAGVGSGSRREHGGTRHRPAPPARGSGCRNTPR